MNVYEGLFIIHPNRYASDPAGCGQMIDQLIQSHGGEILASRLWEERKLAYPIKKERRGAYWLVFFRAPGEAVTPIYADAEINESILRSLITSLDPRIADMLVMHASGEVPEEDIEAESPDVDEAEDVEAEEEASVE